MPQIAVAPPRIAVVDPRRRSVVRSHRRVMSCLISSTKVIDPSRGSVLRLHRRAMSWQISSTRLVDPSRGSVVQSHRRAMSCQISSIFSTRLVDPSRTSVVRSHSKVPLPPTTHTHTHTFRTEQQLTAPADRPVRDLAHAVAFTTAVAIRGAGSVHRRTGMQTARALPVDRNRRGSPPATDCQQNPPPALPAIQTRCFADHRPAWRCDAGSDVRRAVGVCMMGRARGSHRPSGIWQGTLCLKKEVKMILKEPYARAA